MSDLQNDRFFVESAEAASSMIVGFKPPTSINFGSGEASGRLFVEDGKLKFEGNLDESAKALFKFVAENFWVDIEAMKSELAQAKANEKEAKRQLASMRGF